MTVRRRDERVQRTSSPVDVIHVPDRIFTGLVTDVAVETGLTSSFSTGANDDSLVEILVEVEGNLSRFH